MSISLYIAFLIAVAILVLLRHICILFIINSMAYGYYMAEKDLQTSLHLYGVSDRNLAASEDKNSG